MRSLTGLVVGTAGHIDHGKTSLVYALTGIDTDRLKEEKRRGISIDLGFAEMQLPDGPTISFVDVPGHERFVRNMLAGAAGMEAVLLIVAANESVMPQTREHFEICRLLGLRHGLIAVTKCDLATAEQVAQTRRDIAKLVAGSFLAGAPVIQVSAATRSGLAELTNCLSVLNGKESGRDRNGVMRMPIDRSFVVKGFGTVVTGTLLAGAVSVGETLEILPSKIKVRVRGLQAQHASVGNAGAGQRLAANLTGVEQHAVKRGQVLAAADTLASSRVMDVELRWLDLEALPSARELFVLHVGTAETSVRVGLHRHGNLTPRFARLRLAKEIIALPNDRFVLRRPSPAETVGGGVVIDAFPPKRLSRARTLARLEQLSLSGFARRIEIVVDESQAGLSIADLVRMTGASRVQVVSAVAGNAAIVMSSDDTAVTRPWIDAKRRVLLKWLRDYHAANPNAAGAPLAAVRLGLSFGLAAIILRDFDAIRIEGEKVALSSHRATFTAQEVAALERIEQAFRAGGFQPPAIAAAITGLEVDAKRARALLESLVKSNRLTRLPDDLIFHAEVIEHIRSSLAQHKGRRFTVAEFKTWTNISRKFAIPLLEYLDQQRVTKREGDVRVVL